MIANYGYEDGSGFYYVTIDGDVCARCSHHGCISACPQGVYVIELDDYDDLVAAVAEAARKRLRELCAVCKGQNGSGGTERKLPCTAACPAGALRHSW
jgi:ferredoxin